MKTRDTVCKKMAAGLLALCVFILTAPLSAGSQPLKTVRILLLETMPVPVVLEHSRWFITGLEDLGYHRGRNLDLVVMEANGDRQAAEQLLREAIAEKRPDLVVTNATLASQAVLRVLEGSGTPMLFMTVSDPVGAGLIQQIGVPTGSYVAGRVHTIKRETRINMVMRLIGRSPFRKPIRIGFIHSSYPSAVGDLRELKAAGQSRDDIVFVPFQVAYRKVPEGLPGMLKEVAAGIDHLEDQVDFWWEPSGPLGELTEYTRLLLEKSDRRIAMGTKIKAVELGALLHLTPSVEGSGREVAGLAHAILKGADPGKIPPTPPSDFEMGINLKTALDLELVIPPDILRLAGDNVFR